MIKNLKIKFEEDEKTLENLNIVLDILGDKSWDDDYKRWFLEDLCDVGLVFCIKEYYRMLAEDLDGTELSLTEFLEEYGKVEEVKLNNFEEYGFAADFKGEIFKLLKSDKVGKAPLISNGEFYYGVIKNSLGQWIAKEWTKTGKCTNDNTHDLTPIKKEWYEDENNFPALISNGVQMVLVFYSEDGCMFDAGGTVYNLADSDFRIATKTERDSIFCKED